MSEGSIEYDRRFALESSMHTGCLRKEGYKVGANPWISTYPWMLLFFPSYTYLPCPAHFSSLISFIIVYNINCLPYLRQKQLIYAID
jgi:hypothetical protein